MKEVMTVEELDEARLALMEWFTSQGVAPPDAGQIMIDLIAQLCVLKTRDLIKLRENIQTIMMRLTLAVARELRGGV